MPYDNTKSLDTGHSSLLSNPTEAVTAITHPPLNKKLTFLSSGHTEPRSQPELAQNLQTFVNVSPYPALTSQPQKPDTAQRHGWMHENTSFLQDDIHVNESIHQRYVRPTSSLRHQTFRQCRSCHPARGGAAILRTRMATCSAFVKAWLSAFRQAPPRPILALPNG